MFNHTYIHTYIEKPRGKTTKYRSRTWTSTFIRMFICIYVQTYMHMFHVNHYKFVNTYISSFYVSSRFLLSVCLLVADVIYMLGIKNQVYYVFVFIHR